MTIDIGRLPLVLLTLAALAVPAWCQNASAPAADEQQARVAKLIEQLGATDFSLREKAQSELADLGLSAFDALSDAQHHEDIEIALRARFLVRSMQVKWHDDADSPHVVQVLRGYGELGELDRKARIDLLRMPNHDGMYALCRLARYEVSDELSKLAALNVIHQPAIEDAEARAVAAKRIAKIAGTGKRPAAAWLRTYAKTLGDPESALAEWDAYAKAEHDVLTQFPERTSREIVRDLYRYQVTLLQQSHKPERAVAVIRQSLALMEGTPEQLAEIVGWLIHREVWSVVEEVATRFPQVFAESPKLQYLRAEALLKQNQTERAEELARQALQANAENLEHHQLAAEELKKRGMFDWAERELRAIVERAPGGSAEKRTAGYTLAEMLHDMGKELGAAEVLQGLLDAEEKNMAGGELPLEGLRSRMHYFFALDLLEKGEVGKAEERLNEGIKADAEDADVLIALFRLPNQAEQRRLETLKLINSAAEHFRKEINQYKAIAEQELDEATKFRLNNHVANMCNQFAWLVSNTTGDYDEALQCSLKSNELRPKYAAYLDTLGRCYFAKGDFENAVRYQLLAIQEEPHSGQMKRQLALFEKERDAKKEKK